MAIAKIRYTGPEILRSQVVPNFRCTTLTTIQHCHQIEYAYLHEDPEIVEHTSRIKLVTLWEKIYDLLPLEPIKDNK